MKHRTLMFKEGDYRRNNLVPDIPTEEGQIYVSKIVDNEMQMVKISGVKLRDYTRLLSGRIGWEDTDVFLDLEIDNIGTDPTIERTGVGQVRIIWQNTSISDLKISLVDTNLLINKIFGGLTADGELIYYLFHFEDLSGGHLALRVSVMNTAMVNTDPGEADIVIEI